MKKGSKGNKKKGDKSKKASCKQVLPAPTVDDYEHDRYVCTLETVGETLDRYGVAIIDGVISPEECEQVKNGFWDYLEHATSKFDKPIDRNDPTTFAELWKLYPTHGMLMQHFGIGHAQCNWDIRQHPNVANVFSKIWDVPTEDLLVSFDGAR